MIGSAGGRDYSFPRLYEKVHHAEGVLLVHWSAVRFLNGSKCADAHRGRSGYRVPILHQQI